MYSKLVSKVLSERLKTTLPCLISSNQGAYSNGRFISERGRLISNTFEVSDLLKVKGFLLTVDMERDFNSVNHNFLLKVIEKYGISQDFLKWMSALLENFVTEVIKIFEHISMFSRLKPNKSKFEIASNNVL